MLGDNAVYLAKEIEKLNIYESQDRDIFISNLHKHNVLVTAFYHAIGDMDEMMFRFEAGKDREHNMYGFKGKFEAILSIAYGLYLCVHNDHAFADTYPKNFSRIADDLEDMAIRLDYEINNNMRVIDSSRNKEYSKMKSYSH